jgi:glycine cleavage system aminomethyltransferase T
MQKIDAIKKLCSEFISKSGIHSQDIRDYLCISAGIVEDDITHEGCDDWFLRSTADTAKYIMDKLEYCSEESQSKVYFRQ